MTAMMVRVFEVNQDGTERLLSRREKLTTCFPDDDASREEARRELKITGSHVCGGGAAPIFRIVLLPKE